MVNCPNPACGRATHLDASAARCPLRCEHCQELIPAVGVLAREPLPARIGRFEIRDFLGAGAFGAVYRARDPLLDREVALKVTRPGSLENRSRTERFLREARAAASLRHPHLVPVYDSGSVDGAAYIAAAYIEGRTLAQARQEGGLVLPQMVQIVQQLAEALAYSHSRGVIHRDVKPANVLLDARNHAWLTDFGLAHRQETLNRLTQAGDLLGTPAYMAPEQVEGTSGNPLPASDQYSLGVVLYELLTGQTPFSGSPAHVLYSILHTGPPPPRTINAAVPLDLERICLKAMAQRPQDRYADCQAFADDLRRWLDGEPVTARPPGLMERGLRWFRREPALAATCAAALLALLAVVVVPLVMAARLSAAVTRQEAARREALEEAERARRAEENSRAQRQRAQDAVRASKAATAKAETERKSARRSEAAATVEADEEWRYLSLVDARKRDFPRLQYVTDINLGWHFLQRGDLPRLAPLLDRHRPRPGQEDLRGFPWRHLHTYTLVGHHKLDFPAQHVAVAQFLPDGRHLTFALSGREPSALCWELANNKLKSRTRITLPDPMLADAAFLAPDGRLAISGNTLGELYLHDLFTGAAVTLPRQPGSPKRVSFSRDGKLLAVLHYGDTLRVSDVVKRAERWRLSVPGATRIALSAEGSYLAVARGTEIVLRDAATGKEQARLPVRGPVSRLTFAPKDEMRWMLSQGPGEVILWDLATNKPRLTLPPELNGPPRFAPDGQTLLLARTTADSVEWQLWDAQTGKKRVGLPEPGRRGASAAFSPDSRTLALLNASGDTVALWDVRSGKQRSTLPQSRPGVVALAFTPDGERLAVVFGDGVVHVWPRKLLDRTTEVGRPGAAVFSLNLDAGGREAAVLTEQVVDWWDLEANSRGASFRLPRGKVLCAVSPGVSRRMAVADGAGGLKLLDVVLGKERPCGRVLKTCQPVFSKDGERLAAAVAGGAVRVWRGTTGTEIATLRGVGSAVRSLAFSGDGNWLASAGDDGVHVWDLGAANEAIPFKTTGVSSVALSPDGKTLVTGHANQSLLLWNVADKKVRATLQGHRGAVGAVLFSPDGRIIASGGDEGAVRLWEPDSGEELVAFRGEAAIAALAFSANGTVLGAGDKDGRVRLWYAPQNGPGENRFPPPLTKARSGKE